MATVDHRGRRASRGSEHRAVGRAVVADLVAVDDAVAADLDPGAISIATAARQRVAVVAGLDARVDDAVAADVWRAIGLAIIFVDVVPVVAGVLRVDDAVAADFDLAAVGPTAVTGQCVAVVADLGVCARQADDAVAADVRRAIRLAAVFVEAVAVVAGFAGVQVAVTAGARVARVSITTRATEAGDAVGAGAEVLARVWGAVVDVHVARRTGEAVGARTREARDPVGARAEVFTRVGCALVDLELAARAGVAGGAVTCVRRERVVAVAAVLARLIGALVGRAAGDFPDQRVDEQLHASERGVGANRQTNGVGRLRRDVVVGLDAEVGPNLDLDPERTSVFGQHLQPRCGRRRPSTREQAQRRDRGGEAQRDRVLIVRHDREARANHWSRVGERRRVEAGGGLSDVGDWSARVLVRHPRELIGLSAGPAGRLTRIGRYEIGEGPLAGRGARVDRPVGILEVDAAELAAGARRGGRIASAVAGPWRAELAGRRIARRSGGGDRVGRTGVAGRAGADLVGVARVGGTRAARRGRGLDDISGTGVGQAAARLVGIADVAGAAAARRAGG